MIDRHKVNPVTFRPPEDDRAWLEAYAKESGRSAGSILSEALSEYRARVAVNKICDEVYEGIRCAVCEEPFKLGEDLRILPGTEERVHVTCWKGDR